MEELESSFMRGSTRLVSILVVVGLAGVGVVQAQTEKALQKGQTHPIPYISYAEFQATSVGRAVSGKTTSDKSSGEKVTLGDLAFVSSIDKVKRVFGEPETFTHAPLGGSMLTYLTYKGLRLEYIKPKKDNPKSKHELRELELTSSEWSFTVDGKQLRIGMSVDQLSPAVRQTLDRDFSNSVDAFGAIEIAEPGTAEQAKRGGELRQTGNVIQIEVNGGTVDRIAFYRRS